ncbi:peroxiredoxin-like family protein [Lacimicrobium alkaliphilum]|uniref:thioredoxin-dependent peroxiredoxin n=1 Tax=Lacimicrobium alkaliphilum TaxID=1526571 RepID=A0ABQ1R958_9ALTE|nr:peroxiredoxin-like family protein [Lacimicrobium alkaliphilum]GGD59990.1 alkyl hydroperoxide reductase [Lacimicrobium alkaliphilum]
MSIRSALLVLIASAAFFSGPSLALDRTLIADSAEQVTPLLNGQKIPDVSVKRTDGSAVNLRKLVQEKPAVILFYRGGWCPYCNAQLADFRAVEQKISDLGYQILTISTDSVARLQSQKFDTDYKAQVLSDHDLNATRGFGIGFFLDKDTAKKYRGAMGNVFASLPGDDRIVLPAPAVYIADQSGLIHFQYVNPDYKVRVDPELVYHAAKLALK